MLSVTVNWQLIHSASSQVQLMITDSELSDQFSLDTVGSHGSVKCKSHKKEYQVS